MAGSPLVVPIVSAIASIAAALVAWSQAVRAARIKAASDLELERLKLDSERKRKAFEAATAEAEPLKEALTGAWSALQTAKEVIGKVNSQARFPISAALAELEAPHQELLAGFARFGAMLDEETRRAWHSAKTSVGTTRMMLEEYGKVEPLPDDLRHVLTEIRLSLTDHQMVLARSVASLREALAKRISEQL